MFLHCDRDRSKSAIDLDTNTAIAFVAEGSPVRHQLKAFVGNQ
jgi:hypothetical protein